MTAIERDLRSKLELAQARIDAACQAAAEDLYQCYQLAGGQKTPSFCLIADIASGVHAAFMLMTLGRLDTVQYHQLVHELGELSERFDPAQYALVI